MTKLKVFIIPFMLLNICSGQKLPVQFTVSQKTDVFLGHRFESNYVDLKTPMNVFFDSDSLKIQHASGKYYWKTDVIDYNIIENEKNEKFYQILVKKNGFFQYVLIQYSFVFEEMFPVLKIPYIDKKGEVVNYTYFL